MVTWDPETDTTGREREETGTVKGKEGAVNTKETVETEKEIGTEIEKENVKESERILEEENDLLLMLLVLLHLVSLKCALTVHPASVQMVLVVPMVGLDLVVLTILYQCLVLVHLVVEEEEQEVPRG